MADHEENLHRFGWNDPSEFLLSGTWSTAERGRRGSCSFHQLINLQWSVCQPEQVLSLCLVNVNVVVHALLSSTFIVHLFFFFSYLFLLLVLFVRARYTVLLIPTPSWSGTDGELNLHMDSSSSDARQLTGILEFFDLHQYVDFSTHINGHSSNLMIWSTGCNVLYINFWFNFGPLFCCWWFANSNKRYSDSRKLSSTENYRRSTLKPLRLSKILNWFGILKLTQLDWLNNMSVLCSLINLHALLVTKNPPQAS